MDSTEDIEQTMAQQEQAAYNAAYLTSTAAAAEGKKADAERAINIMWLVHTTDGRAHLWDGFDMPEKLGGQMIRTQEGVYVNPAQVVMLVPPAQESTVINRVRPGHVTSV